MCSVREARDQEVEREHGDRAPEDMVECEFWDNTKLQKDGDPVKGIQDFQGTGHWSADTDNNYLSSNDEKEEEESSNSKHNLSSEEEG